VKNLVEKPEKKRLLETPKRMCEDSIKTDRRRKGLGYKLDSSGSRKGHMRVLVNLWVP
jgi:hypothetical protein